MDVFRFARPRFHHDLILVAGIANARTELRYNGTGNFMARDLYLGFKDAYLHSEASVKFHRASRLLASRHPELRFVIYDALRPRSVQRLMREFVANSPYQDYVADPEIGSLHNFGMAIDLTLEDAAGPLDMGTEFDDFTELAQPRVENELLAKGKLTIKQIENRKILRSIMESSGFTQLPQEWWHYNAGDAQVIRESFEIVE